MQTPSNDISRRDFIKLSAISGAVLAIGCVPTSGKKEEIVNLNKARAPGIGLNAYICIDEQGKMVLYNHRPEMVQGTFQAIPMVLAEELEVNIDQIEIQQSPADRKEHGDQMVVGSRSIPIILT